MPTFPFKSTLMPFVELGAPVPLFVTNLSVVPSNRTSALAEASVMLMPLSPFGEPIDIKLLALDPGVNVAAPFCAIRKRVNPDDDAVKRSPTPELSTTRLAKEVAPEIDA